MLMTLLQREMGMITMDIVCALNFPVGELVDVEVGVGTVGPEMAMEVEEEETEEDVELRQEDHNIASLSLGSPHQAHGKI
jgi:hypothetical protein